MITDIPVAEEYNILGIEWLLQALGIVVDESHFEDTDYEKTLNTQLYTAKFLLFQSIECFLKRQIGLQSIFLLIDSNDRDTTLPTLSGSPKRSFNDIYAHTPETLLRIYSGIYKHNTELEIIFSNLKKSRNKIVHSLYREKITIKELCADILKISNLYKINIRAKLKEKDYNSTGVHPYFYGELLEILDNNLSKKEMESIFGKGTFKGWCGDDCSSEDTATIFYPVHKRDGECVCCGDKYKIIEKECNQAGCIGKFKYESERGGHSVCLKCGQ